MSLSLTRGSEKDIDIAHIFSESRFDTVYLSENKINEAPPNGIVIDASVAQLFIGKSVQDLKQLFQQMRTISSTPCEITVGPNEIVSIIPAPKPELIYITGQKGWGKSSLSARYAIEYHTKFPNNMIYLFTRMADDIAYEGVECEEIVVNENVIDSGLVFENLHDSLVIFDDLDNITDTKVHKWIHGLINEAITCGRKERIHIIYISHLIMDYKRTRVILNEAEKVIFFNGSGTYQNTNFLRSYAGLDKHQIKELISLKGWVCLNRINPMYVISKDCLFVLK